MTGTMRAARVHEFVKPLTIDEVPEPNVGPGQALVKIQASGVCYTDLHAAKGDWPVKSTITPDRLENINTIFDKMRLGDIEGRIVLDMQ